MTDEPERDHATVLADTIRILSEAARLTRPVLEQDITGSAATTRSVWRESDRREQADFADFLAHALAAVAANVGGTERLLAGRPGSWEADLTRQLIAETVGHDDDHLSEHRTDPLRIVMDLNDLWDRTGLDEAYDQAYDELGRREDELTTDADGNVADPAAAAELRNLETSLEAQRQSDETAYLRALTTCLRRLAIENGFRVPIEIDTAHGLQGKDNRIGPEDDFLTQAISDTSLPGDGRAPLDRASTALKSGDTTSS